MAPDFEHIRLIYNPGSGKRRLHKDKARLQAAFDQTLGRDILEFSPTTRPGDATTLAAEAVSRWGENGLVILAGGDGSAGEAAQGLAGSRTPLLILPYGSGNDFSRTIYRGHSRDPVDILAAAGLVPGSDAAAGLRLTPIDLMRARAERYQVPAGQLSSIDADGSSGLDRYVLNVISIGYDSTVAIAANRYARRWPWLGGGSYVLGVLTETFKDLHYEMLLGWVDEAGEQRSAAHSYSLCAVCNASFYGSGYQPNPDGYLNDGLLETFISRWVRLSDFRLAGAYRRGELAGKGIFTPYNSRDYTFRSTDGRPLVATLDGEGVYCDELRVTAAADQIILALPAAWGQPKAIRPALSP